MASLMPKQEAYRENCDLTRHSVSNTVWLCLNYRMQKHAWLCLNFPSGWDLPVCQHSWGRQVFGVCCCAPSKCINSLGYSLIWASSETSLAPSRRCCRGIIIQIRDKMDPTPNLKRKQMQFQLTEVDDSLLHDVWIILLLLPITFDN